MMVLDTHTLVWWVSGSPRLSVKAKQAIEEQTTVERSLLVSSISAWEIAMLVAKGRLALTMDVTLWLATVEKIPSIQFIPVDNAIAVQATRLPGELHKDPADRMIVALAHQQSLPIVTADQKIRDYAHVKTLW